MSAGPCSLWRLYRRIPPRLSPSVAQLAGHPPHSLACSCIASSSASAFTWCSSLSMCVSVVKSPSYNDVTHRSRAQRPLLSLITTVLRCMDGPRAFTQLPECDRPGPKTGSKILGHRRTHTFSQPFNQTLM